MLTVDEIWKVVHLLNIDDDEFSLTNKAAVVILYSMHNDTQSVNKIKKATGFTLKQVNLFIGNLWKSRIIPEYGKWNTEYLNHIPIGSFETVIELTMLSMAACGDLVTDKFKKDDPRFIIK